MDNAINLDLRSKIASYLDEQSIAMSQNLRDLGATDESSFLSTELSRFSRRVRDLIGLQSPEPAFRPAFKQGRPLQKGPKVSKKRKMGKKKGKKVQGRTGHGGSNPLPQKKVSIDQGTRSRFLNKVRSVIAKSCSCLEQDISLDKRDQMVLISRYLENPASKTGNIDLWLQQQDPKDLVKLRRATRKGRTTPAGHTLGGPDGPPKRVRGVTGSNEPESTQGGESKEECEEISTAKGIQWDSLVCLMRTAKLDKGFKRESLDHFARHVASVYRDEEGDSNVTNLASLKTRVRQAAKELQLLVVQSGGAKENLERILSCNNRLLVCWTRLLRLGGDYVPKNLVQYSIIVPTDLSGLVEKRSERRDRWIINDPTTLLKLLRQQQGQAPWISSH